MKQMIDVNGPMKLLTCGLVSTGGSPIRGRKSIAGDLFTRRIRRDWRLDVLRRRSNRLQACNDRQNSQRDQTCGLTGRTATEI